MVSPDTFHSGVDPPHSGMHQTSDSGVHRDHPHQHAMFARASAEHLAPPFTFTSFVGSEVEHFEHSQLADTSSQFIYADRHGWAPGSPSTPSTSCSELDDLSSASSSMAEFEVPSMQWYDSWAMGHAVRTEAGIDPSLLHTGSPVVPYMREQRVQLPVSSMRAHCALLGSQTADEDDEEDADGEWVPESQFFPRAPRLVRAHSGGMTALSRAFQSIELPEDAHHDGLSGGGDTIRAGQLRPSPQVYSPPQQLDPDYTPYSGKVVTRKSRGRRPVELYELGLVPGRDPNLDMPTRQQISYAGRTKTGKVKKVFLCQISGCGRCFKRSEHLRRHVRSIHSNEKPYECPECGKGHSRQDNLAQHRRGVHKVYV